jgi:acyl-CoA synthetase (NDP forming)
MTVATEAHARLRRALSPASVAVLGASPRPESLSRRFLSGLVRHGFAGSIVAVNPNYEDVDGIRCVPSVGDAGGVDLAVLSVPKRLVLASLEECAAAGVAGAVVFASGYSETGDRGREDELEITELAHRTGLRVLGPNSPGLVNLTHSCCVIASGVGFRERLLPGGVAVIAQSGGVAGLLTERAQDRGIGISSVVCTGNESDVKVGEIMMALADDDATRVIALFLEGVRDGAGFTAGLDALRLAGKTAVVLKVGAAGAAARASAAHTGALVTDADVFAAVLARHGALAVQSLDDLLEAAAAVERHGPARSTAVGIITTSGGAGVVATEAAERAGLALPPLAESTRVALAAAVPDFASLANPADMSGMFSVDDEIFRGSLRAFLDAGEYEAIVLVLTVHPGPLAERLADRILELGPGRAPLVVLWIAGAMSEPARQRLRAAGVLVVDDPDRCMRMLAARAAAGRGVAGSPDDEPAPHVPHALDDARGTHAALEHEALATLAELGVPVAETRFCVSAAEARAAAEEIDATVAVKAAARDLPHKGAAGAVVLGVVGPDACAEAYERVVAAARGAGASPVGAVVQRQAKAGRELIIGARRDPVFGPVLVVGGGGTGVEEHGRVTRRLLPLARGEAAGLVEWTGGTAAVAAAIHGVAALALALGDELEAVEINPLIVDDGGATAVDALVLFAPPPTEPRR